ncbi:MAG: cupin-like domain-containing protein [Congregibacter sp.]
MQRDIDRLSIDELTYAQFISDYLKPEKPVVLTDVRSFDQAALTPDYIKRHYSKESRREAGWFDADLLSDQVIRKPELVSKVLCRDDVSLRESPMRIFMQPGGHVTLPHYDGNSLHGFNLQVVGRKRWIITSPNTPLPNIPFMFVGLVGERFRYDPSRLDFYEFDTMRGDLLFLPRYFYHEVHSLDPVNVNVNWVFTPTSPNEGSILGRREVEIVKLRKTIPLVNRAFFPDDFSSYGGSGGELIENYSRTVSNGRMIGRLLKEIAGYPRLLVLARQLRRRANEFSSNNFNV